MERAFGADFSGVRVHTDPEADALNQQISAKAFIAGPDMFFREGEYSPGSDTGRELIAHELTHVVQQVGSRLPHSIQRSNGDLPDIPYDASNRPPKFEYWVNSMWREVEDEVIKHQALNLLKGTEQAPQPGENIDKTTKKPVMDLLYANAYKERAWVSAQELLQEKSLEKVIILPGKEIVAVGFHGTGRKPETVLKVHGGTIPTVARHKRIPSEKKAIQDYLEKEMGINREWHPFWFGGEIEKRPFLFRNVQKDNELDTSVSVAKVALDSIDFPMIESMAEGEKSQYDYAGFPVTETYV